MLETLGKKIRRLRARRRRKLHLLKKTRRGKKRFERDGDRVDLMEFQVPSDWIPYWSQEFKHRNHI